MPDNHLRPGARRVQDELARLGRDLKVVEFDASTRTSADAAAAIGCNLGQIAKSLIFRAEPSGRPILVVASGANRVDVMKVEHELGETLAKADAQYVREKTGFPIGGVPPVGHAERPVTFIDRDLLGFTEIWAAAGTPNTVFRLTPQDLVELTGGRVIAVA